jgi:hypothetical protein
VEFIKEDAHPLAWRHVHGELDALTLAQRLDFAMGGWGGDPA